MDFSFLHACFNKQSTNCPFVPDYLFKDACIVNSSTTLWSRGQVCSQSNIIKVMASP